MTQVAERALFTPDVPRLADFYERLLGVAADDRSDSHATFDLGGVSLFIHVTGGPADFYWGRSAYLRDPDGRAVELQPDT